MNARHVWCLKACSACARDASPHQQPPLPPPSDRSALVSQGAASQPPPLRSDAEYVSIDACSALADIDSLAAPGTCTFASAKALLATGEAFVRSDPRSSISPIHDRAAQSSSVQHPIHQHPNEADQESGVASITRADPVRPRSPTPGPRCKGRGMSRFGPGPIGQHRPAPVSA